MLTILTLLSALLYSSLIEYCLHRFLLHHSAKQRHIKNHHKIFHGIKSYEINEAHAEDIISSKKYILSNVVPALPIALIIFFQSKFLGVLFILTSFIYTLWVEYVHLYFHRNTNNFLEEFKFFQKLKEHHRVHHYIYNSNYGIACTFWDIVFKTKTYK